MKRSAELLALIRRSRSKGWVVVSSLDLPRNLCRLLAASAAAMSVVALSTPAAADDSNAAFEQYCIGCHGPDGRGIENLGVDLVDSPFVVRTSEQGLVEFLAVGRLPDDPETRAGRPMPGFSWVPESELKSIAAFLKSRSGRN